jgi:hypothetical protein
VGTDYAVAESALGQFVRPLTDQPERVLAYRGRFGFARKGVEVRFG